MEYRHLGKTGIKVSELSLGSWITFKNQVDVDAAVEIMAAAYDLGVNFFDNAEAYARGKSGGDGRGAEETGLAQGNLSCYNKDLLGIV